MADQPKKASKLFTNLKYKRARGDMIETFKIYNIEKGDEGDTNPNTDVESCKHHEQYVPCTDIYHSRTADEESTVSLI